MINIHHTNIYKIHQYSQHLKALPDNDKRARFGFPASSHTIDQLILSMCYNPEDHELWYARIDDQKVGWGHMASNKDGSWELAVSVDHEHQLKGIGDKLITEMIAWAKFHHVTEVYMHCIAENKVIQHLAQKHGLHTKERSIGDRTDAIEVPDPTILEAASQRLKEQNEIIKEIKKLQIRLTNLWIPV